MVNTQLLSSGRPGPLRTAHFPRKSGWFPESVKVFWNSQRCAVVRETPPRIAASCTGGATTF